jgi:hypothetical protein
MSWLYLNSAFKSVEDIINNENGVLSRFMDISFNVELSARPPWHF